MGWFGLSTVVNPKDGMNFQLETFETANTIPLNKKVEIIEKADKVIVNTGILQCSIPKTGDHIIQSIKLEGNEISSFGRLICISQNGMDKEFGSQPVKEKFIGSTEKLTIEQNGPVRAVIKIEGKHLSESGNRSQPAYSFFRRKW